MAWYRETASGDADGNVTRNGYYGDEGGGRTYLLITEDLTGTEIWDVHLDAGDWDFWSDYEIGYDGYGAGVTSFYRWSNGWVWTTCDMDIDRNTSSCSMTCPHGVYSCPYYVI